MKLLPIPSKQRVHKVVSAGELEYETRQGWYVVGTIEVSEVMDAQEVVVSPYSNSGGGYHGYNKDTVNVRRVHPTTKFVLALADEDVMSELREALAVVRNNEANLNQEVTRLTKELEAATARTKVVSDFFETAKKDNASLAERIKQLRDTTDKMEKDVAKLRNAIGDLRMKEILEGK